MQGYVDNKYELGNVIGIRADELVVEINKRSRHVFRKFLMLCTLFILVVPIVGLYMFFSNLQTIDLEEDDANIVAMASSPLAATTEKTDTISVPVGMVKANPFLPYRSLGDEEIKPVLVNDVPQFSLIEPPEVIEESSEAAKVMDTIVSGILFDKYSPTAIINIGGSDFLVKKGDVINNYKVMNIMKDSVTVKLGNNTYTAGIGEIIQKDSVNFNEISNLNKKFGGVRR